MEKLERRNKRKKRIRSKIIGTKNTPRLSVFRSNNHIYAQLIDDKAGNTLVWANDINIKEKISKLEIASKVGDEIAKKALKKKIKMIVFDRGGYKYHGRVRAVAEGARKGGLVF